MKSRHRIDVEGLLARRAVQDFTDLADDLQDQASAAAVAKNPRRAFYLGVFAGQAHQHATVAMLNADPGVRALKRLARSFA